MKVMRKGITGLQTPSMIFADKDDHRIVLRGMCHIADTDFYVKTQDKIATFNGEVHFEGIKSPKSTEDMIEEIDGEALGRLAALMFIYQYVAAVFNVDTQTNHLDPDFIKSQPHYKNYDLTIDDVLPISTEGLIKQVLDSFLKLDGVNMIGSGSAKLLARPQTLALMLTRGNKANPFDTTILLDKRNEHAINHALETRDNGQDVMLVWGAEHLEGMSELLEQNKYKHFHTEWDTVIPWIESEPLSHSERVYKERNINELQAQIIDLIKLTNGLPQK